jgi:hypothetical protein
MVFLLHLAFKSIAVALCFFRNGPLRSGYFLSFAIRMSPPFDAKKAKEKPGGAAKGESKSDCKACSPRLTE